MFIYLDVIVCEHQGNCGGVHVSFTTKENSVSEQLVSVRLSAEMIEKLRALADVNETNVAEEIRKSIEERFDRLPSNEKFRELTLAAIERSKERMSRLLQETQ